MREDLPTGTVTFLFTDIEGSTRLLHELGEEAYATALAEHRRLIREACDRRGGSEVDTQGDAFFIVFTRASDAVGAAKDGQRALSSGPIRVRMGIHTGEAVSTGEGYAGLEVHRAARICGAGNGGQVLLSETTRGLIDGDLRDLGPHRLKDLSAPQRLYQLGQADFPPLKTLYQTNLPVQPTPLIGRAREQIEAEALVRDHKLITLIGPGGIGKTRLALQIAADVASDFPDGVWWVPLAAVREPAFMAPSIAQALGLQLPLAAEISQKRMLLLLDNFEQLVGAAGELAELLAASPALHVLVTSRRPLRLRPEHLYEVAPLTDADAIVLFTDRALMHDRGFVATSDIREICRRLDGLPLAIELAAARCRLLGPSGLLGRLEQRLPLLTGGPRDAPGRQQTLRATIDWSYELLDASEQTLLTRLSVFAGGSTIAAAEVVCDASLDKLASLQDASLIRRRNERLFLLDTIHEYATERLGEIRDAADLAERHARYYASVAEDLGLQIQTRRQGSVITALAGDVHNLRQALEWASANAPDVLLGIVGDLARYWALVGSLEEGRRWTDAALAIPGADLDPRRVRVLLGAAGIAMRTGRREAMSQYALEALERARSLDDAAMEGRALGALAIASTLAHEAEQARSLYGDAVAAARRAGDDWGLALALGNLAYLQLEVGDAAHAEELIGESIVLKRELGDKVGIASGLCNLGLAAVRQRRLPQAADAFLESIELSVEIDLTDDLVSAVVGCAAVASLRGRKTDAAVLLAGADMLAAGAGLALQPVEQALRDETAEAVAAELHTSERAEATGRGRSMPMSELLEYARDTVR